ncbi:DUF551 domain-containing protein [Anaerotignum sp. MB30-C6]|uniref:DUF551 domain-containing protein n=1 Tax=Anaerotignum sp. MB30-C6 TaxID=3070814 RepID=UPI0027DAEEE6|nr:DUF551 domain-containing protein [Anaerotignum sp. MB30-C6]WMI80920.1 DUF551 domain-containing protein [Anaerotignum sp. MB30-C6]WMI81924.1 DUF551 domain-containing protein [Anaerotignum sp. MB30-C6]
MSRWISVKDRLPKEREEVWIACKSGAFLAGEYYMHEGKQNWSARNVAGTLIHIATKHITHWAIPEPPKECLRER